MELRRDHGGKVVVTAGPVTRAAGTSERLIREGYVQALLGGNAIAVHDIEQNLMGTSCGYETGVVRGGHRHHLKVINTIRRYGSIAKAVSKVVKSGCYTSVSAMESPSLAGSIRDDRCLIRRWI